MLPKLKRENLERGVHFALVVRCSYNILKNQNMPGFSIISLSVCFEQMTAQCQAVASWGTGGKHRGGGGGRAGWVHLCSCVRTTVSACRECHLIILRLLHTSKHKLNNSHFCPAAWRTVVLQINLDSKGKHICMAQQGERLLSVASIMI